MDWIRFHCWRCCYGRLYCRRRRRRHCCCCCCCFHRCRSSKIFSHLPKLTHTLSLFSNLVLSTIQSNINHARFRVYNLIQAVRISFINCIKPISTSIYSALYYKCCYFSFLFHFLSKLFDQFLCVHVFIVFINRFTTEIHLPLRQKTLHRRTANHNKTHSTTETQTQ